MPVGWDPPADRGELARWAGPGAKVEEISPSRKQPVSQAESEKADSAPARALRAGAPMRRLAWILAGGFVTAGIGIVFYIQAQKRPLPLASVSQAAVEVAPPVPANASTTTVALSEPTQPTVAVDPMPTTAVPESKPRQAPSPPESKRSSPATARVPIVTPVVADEDSTAEPRLEIAQPPESGFRYPEAPSSTLTGKINLRAVIGIDGTVTKIDVLSGNRALAAAAVQAVRHWRYPVPEMNGHPVEAETNIAITFVGDDAVSVSFPAAR